ncbi:putative N-acetylglucosaminyltransferase subunit [Teratosphaeria nubilosa]|uniref:Putative N-acetylglucosaminyltransferase subunit n=1 Tax=Teratosphaeria nubilosa TaxID=161662 RepID=A0A6G1LDH6_9PEZI|nr:putative N-acetylglucosaminyltransferase subunit [Teratosphaeria nubilosa]
MTTKKHGLMRIFWPSDAPRDDIPAVLVGWRNSELDVLVVGVLQGVDVKNVEHALRVHSLFRGSPHPIEQILERCGKLPLQVLGTLNAPSTVLGFNPKLVSVRYGRRDTAPRIDCPADAGVAIQVMMFDRPDPNRMQYLSMTPISLALGDKHGAYGSLPPFDQIDKEEEAAKRRKLKLVEKLKLHTVIRHPRTPKELALPTIISQINCSAEIDNLMHRNIGLVGVRMKRTLSVSERMVESATNAWDTVLLSMKQALIQNVWPVASQIFILVLMAQRIMAEGILSLLDWRPLPNSPAALKDVSATAQQLDIRLQQFCYWPVQYSTLQQRRNNWESITKSHPEYIRFYNSLWLVANDVIIGIAIGSYILENADTVAALVDDTVDRYSIAGLQRMITWLMDWPAGLKLNNELAKFLGDLFLWVIDYWDGSMIQLRPLLPHIVRLIGVSSFAGASMPISLFSDLVSLLTIHIYSFYIASARIYNWQLTIIHSLFHLFRGKKRNILRNRIDSCDYDLDQLLLGTILFTVLFFLLPTVAVFYATFAGARMGIIALKAALDTWLACLNHFPLFAIMLRLKDSRRIPGGIRFELQDTPSASLIMARSSAPPKSSASHAHACTPTSYIKLKSVPLPLSQTFSQYAQLGHRLRKHYLSPRVFWCLITGQFVPPIHRKNLYSLQYSMLPAQRVSITELWNLLHRKEAGAPHANGNAVSPTLNKGAGKKTKGYWWSR